MSEHETDHTTSEPGPSASGSTKIGFWRRMFGAKTDADPTETETEAEAETPEITTVAQVDDSPEASSNLPRKRSRTIFDRAEQERRKRFSRAAKMRRERLAGAIGDRVEEVLTDHLVDDKQRWSNAAASVDEMNGLLGAIGRNLDEQGQRAERMADSLEQLPELAKQEQQTLGQIAERLQTQAQSVEGVPEVVDLVRFGSGIAKQKLAALRSLQDELALQREQRSQMLQSIRKSAIEFQDRMSKVEEAVQTSMLQARTDATAVREAIDRSSETLTAQAREEALKVSQRARRLEEGLRQVSAVMLEGAALANAQARSQQDEAIGFLHTTQDELLTQFQRSQTETVATMERLQAEVKEREERLQAEVKEREERQAWRLRTALIGCAGLLAVVGAMITFSPPTRTASPESVRIVRVPVAAKVSPAPTPAPTASPAATPAPKQAARPRRASTGSLPAGMPRSPKPATAQGEFDLIEMLWGKKTD